MSGQCHVFGWPRHRAEEVALTSLGLGTCTTRHGEDRVDASKHLGAVGTQSVECASLGETFKCAAIQLTRIHPPRKIAKRAEGAFLLSHRHQMLHHSLADILESGQGINDGAVGHFEIHVREINARRDNPHSDALRMTSL